MTWGIVLGSVGVLVGAAVTVMVWGLRAMRARSAADQALAAASGALAEARRIEEFLIRPRWALDIKAGTRRRIAGVADFREGEVVIGQPTPECPRCHGKGWDGRDVKTGLVQPCKCCPRPRG